MTAKILQELAISDAFLEGRNLIRFDEASDLVLAETAPDGRQFLLTEATANAWRAMKAQAARDGIELLMLSAFRSIERQADIIREKLKSGLVLEDILEVCAPPGYSEHHTGRAIDIASSDDPCLEIRFEHTGAFAWLQINAKQFGFKLSYPRENRYGFQYEPWHWCFECLG